MNRPGILSFVAAALLAGGCEMRVGDEASDAQGNAMAAGNVSASGKAEEGQLSVSAPGFELKLAIPEGIRSRAGIDDEGGLIFPGAQFSGIHVQGGREGAGGESDGQVELRFTSRESPEAVARWYLDPARAGDFTVSGESRDANARVIAGTTREDGGRFEVRLAPGAGGGSEGRLLLSDRG